MRNGLAAIKGSLLVQWTIAAFFAAIMASAIAAPNPAATPKKEEGFQTAAPYAILIEAESGSVLYEKNADELSPPASLSKLMTAEVVFNEIKEGNLKLDDEFVISTDAWRRGGAPSGGSTMFAPIHSRVKVEDLLRGVIIQSGNDACIALAQGIAGNEDAFTRLMEARAREIGLRKSQFANSTGFHDPGHLMTVRELAMLSRHIISTYPEFYPIYSEREFTWNKIRQQNRNPLLAMNLGADGLKTGFTKEAGYGLAGSAVHNDLRFIVVVNGLKSADERAHEAKRILEHGFRNFESRILFAEGQIIGDAKVLGGAKGSVQLITPKIVRIMVPRNVNERIVARIVYQGPVPTPVEEGQRIGVVKVFRGNALAVEAPLKAAESIGPGSLPQRALNAVTELVIGLFRTGVSRI
jgi:D-alanyl-D-alanine carboxypeptidase (penicillin-binding protein 5/6)